jgi:hypothetical protein
MWSMMGPHKPQHSMEELSIESSWDLMLFVDLVFAWFSLIILSPPWKLSWAPCIVFNIVNLHLGVLFEL